MNKKILAVIMVFVVIVTCFAACKRHNYKTTNVNGQDLLLYTDKDGNTVINDDNQIIAVVTDEAGEIITYENGEEQTRMVQISGSYIGDGYMQGKEFKMSVPKGWEATESAKMYKEGTENKCYIAYMTNNKFKSERELVEYFENHDAQEEAIKAGIETQGHKYEITKEAATVGNYNGWHYTNKITDNEGNIVNYAETIYFIDGTKLCIVNYVCYNGIGYDEAFNFGTFVQEGFEYNG